MLLSENISTSNTQVNMVQQASRSFVLGGNRNSGVATTNRNILLVQPRSQTTGQVIQVSPQQSQVKQKTLQTATKMVVVPNSGHTNTTAMTQVFNSLLNMSLMGGNEY